ncbi:MAG: hypothetical protein ABI565_03315, partial [Vicinamibacteria bacterium]
MPSIESAFEFLFKYRPAVFEAGEVSIGAGPSGALVRAGLIIALAFSVWSYRLLRTRLRTGDLILLLGLRMMALSLLAAALLAPTLRVLTVAPQQTFVGVLLDDSQSLTIQDDRGHPRGDFSRDRLLAPSGDLRRALEQKFKVRYFRFSDSVER